MRIWNFKTKTGATDDTKIRLPMKWGRRKGIIEDVDVVSESVSFLAEPKKFTIQAEGDLSQAKVEIKEDETTKIDAADKVKAKYSIEYLKKMIGGSKISDSVVVQFSKDYPLRIEYKEVDRMTLSFILAPRVEND